MNYTLRVTEIRQETKDTITVCFKQPGLKKIRYLAGQYLTLIFRIDGRRYLRPYSFSSAPLVDQHLEITVKRVPQGIVSNYIHDHVKIGDVVEVLEPMGDFLLDVDDTDALFFWGGGSGITPLLSLIKVALTNHPRLQVNLIYCNRSAGTTIFHHAINELHTRYSSNFNVWNFYTQYAISEIDPTVIEGRINAEHVIDITKDLDHMRTKHYICGPIGLKQSVKIALQSLGVPTGHVFSEDFELLKDPKKFEDIHTEIIKLTFQGADYDLEIAKGKSILESALDAGIELPYSCQTGSCSTCKGYRVQGKVKMIGLPKDRDDLLDDEYLLCCTHPLSSHVHIKI